MIISPTQPIVLASSNPGKIREIQAILDGHPILPQSQFKVVEAEETGCTFIENAIIKARNAANYAQLPAIADDSGLVVDSLDGAPGVISARYAGVGASDQDNLNKLLSELEGIPENRRTARFICVMVFMKHAMDPCPVIAQGVWEGLIMTQPQGENGFGYDPVFWVPEFTCASAQLSPELKNSVSHRGQALRALIVALGSSKTG
ncbi:RdgB/HAM1 family non-canonical purine NTP pyrophosphatase [Methylicorpusculum sp.]|uniref:RdgB/HAM1 family non-canonical purine NTP pyrophosphatase n=1 Tax=Methylicorpusculum sp. TaxID=2713644 RepID=UPI002721499F|nr:RdgB/HAM1 family non-canonical purine NTP pyrophosphatase [Methylicorpusculum sp.]MDO8845216.1 RdgB/HAM1 family non-canonical purine NTP pyrophosphatase [Methylicorpusculum sp.]MDO9238802.1 RdgB/HAM1 family non-canonical purine NTP pyrophosphatase [Methylicorpusculum sp.]MDP2180346.1 RdgB/HAM1 family non-canonical purine NTP pyrophosphatase [Methylicorpusculum sp.]MDP3528631.1 RdgB/HAM1 family non-canonical purine NTP pyrophosphatase [Methylicorpusculum sp.]MDZ4152481.1 RdgB/HAM1 family non